MIVFNSSKGYLSERISQVKSYALDNPYKLVGDTLENGIIPGDNPKHVLHTKEGLRIVYSITIMDDIHYHHLSISKKDSLPTIQEAEIISTLFGMGSDIHHFDNIYIEEELQAVNLIKNLNT